MPRASFQSTPGRAATTIGYGQDLAFIHDDGFGQVARDAARLLVARLRPISHVGRPRVIDLGCGSGILTREAAAALSRIFRRVHEALRPGGIFLFDLATPGRGGGRGKRQKNSEGKDWAILLETEEDVARSILTRRIVSFRRVGRLYRRGEEVHCLRLYRAQEVKRMLRRAGFRFTSARGYGSARLPSRGWITVVATKPALRHDAAAAARQSARSRRSRARSSSE